MNSVKWEESFKKASELLFSNLKEGESLNLNFDGEETTFLRLNNAKIRQASTVEQGSLELELHLGQKKADFGVPLTLNQLQNEEVLKEALANLQKEVRSLPDDPFISPLTNEGTSRTVLEGELPDGESFIKAVVKETLGADLAGYLTTGQNYRANANSLGQHHWFSSDSFFFDYSLYTAKEKAVKGSYAGSHYKESELIDSLDDSIRALEVMDRDQVELKPGAYKCYLAPSALNEIAGLLGWSALSGGSYKRGDCPLADLYEGKQSFNSEVTIQENFNLGLSPRFNEWGEVSKEVLPLIEQGKMKELFVSRETANEYGLTSNQASSSEGPRALEILPGNLKREDILKEIGTGLYLSNLHYLNWSDKNKGRITGMTRFGCLWIENGEVVGPIKDLRFDETLYHIFGSGLKALTDFSEVMMETGTYSGRSLGGAKLPGMVVEGFKFTL